MTEKRDIEISLRSKAAESAADRLNQKIKGVGGSADNAESSFSKLTKVAAAVGAALATAQIQKYADAWTNVNNRLNAATSTQAEFLTAQKGVIAIAQQAGVDLAGVADGYSRIAQNTAELGLSQARVLDITKKVTLAIKAGGATAQEAASVIVQLGQGLGSGALQGDELKSIMEASIPITKALAKEFGVTTGELKKLGADGEITADRVVSAIERMDEKSLTFTKDISGGFTEVSNALIVYVGSVDESLGVTEKITGLLSSTAKNLDVVVNGVTTLAVLIGAKYVGSLTSAIVAQTALTAAGLRGTVQMNALGQVTARTTVAMNIGAVAAKGLGASLAIVGGPVGLALIAAYALYEFIDSSDLTAKSAKLSSTEIDGLSESFDKLSQGAKITALSNLNKEMELIRKEITETASKANEFEEKAKSETGLFSASTIKAATARARVKELNDELDILSDKQGALIGGPDLSGGTDRGNINNDISKPKGSADKVKDSGFESLKARLQLETEAIQSEAEVRRAFAEGQINQRQLDEELALQSVYFNYESRRAAILENEKLTAEQKSSLIAELAQQEIDAEQIKQDQITDKTQEGADKRAKLELLASNAKIDNLRSGASSALSLLSAFGNQSSKTQKKFAIADAIVNIASGVAKALNNPYPANLGFALQVAAQGAGLLSTIKGASPGGASASPSVSSAPAPAAIRSPSTENQTQDRIINITGLDGFGDDQPIPLTVGGLRALLSSNEDVSIAINQGQSNAQRIGAI